nr:hypothetical protein [Lysinibacillus timonensis]
MLRIAILTSIAASIFLTISLLALSFFKFIQWNPVDYTNRFGILQHNHELVKWTFLGIILAIIILIFFLIMQYVALVPAFFSSLVIGGVVALIIEWIIYGLPAELSSFSQLSVPFIITVIITARFVFETASFHYQANMNERENKLPYKDSMIK